jgi:LuxR family transcriptional regulator, maltose regulon positive regulatory protein
MAAGVSAAVESVGPVLVATKLHAPPLRSGLVARDELVARLLADPERKLTLVCAPAGWGKSTLLSVWSASPGESRPFAWVLLDPADSDPVRFWGYVIATLRSVDPELGSAPLAGLRSAGRDLVDVVVAPLINELAALEARLVLVLDDYQFVHGEAVHASVAFLLRHLPATLHVAIASRVDPPLPVAGLRAAGQVTEIRAGDLRFSEAEAEELLNGSLGLDLDPADVQLLRERTEGWAAGLQLAALSARTVEDRNAFASEFAGSDRLVGDYLRELLADRDPGSRDFLLETSILERLCAALCDAVTGRRDASEQLDAIERGNLFLIPLDARGEWYRYHHLFRDLLRHELMRAAPGVVLDLHRRASAWHREQGNVEESIHHATVAGEVAEAGELIARHWRAVWNRGERETVAAWIDALPREAVLGDPRLCLARGWTSLFLAPHEVEPWVLAAERGSPSGPLHDAYGSVEANAALLRCVHAYFGGDVGAACEHARTALGFETGEASSAWMGSRLVLALPLIFAGEPEQAAGLLEEALRPGPRPDLAEPFLAILGALALSRVNAGDLLHAERHLADADDLIRERRLDQLPSVAYVHMASGLLLEQRGDLAEPDGSFVRAGELARRGGLRLELAFALLLLARVKRRRRDHAAARSLAHEARDVLAACPDPGELRALLARTEHSLQVSPTRRGARALAADVELTARELTILRLLAGELSQREIGTELHISLNTVKSHTRSIFRKLDVTGRGEAVARARELGLI